MNYLDPTYLRYIYDGLIKGSVHSENESELPDGLIGLYDEAFEEHLPVLQRQQLLQRFALFALLKKEVSVAFVAEVLGESEAVILEFINAYASWFNSPEPGKFQLYHERLKVYVLQKLSAKEIQKIHEKLIARLELSIEEKLADEFDRYALEFLSEHFFVSAMLNGDGKKLIELAYTQTYWQRQLKISKGYSWSKNGLKAVMSWASKYKEDEVIECGLQIVDLHHQEQNAAPQIVALVVEGDFDSALKRIEEFGGNDEEGVQRKFILYMLCLMELTLVDSKDKPFSKEGIEKLLKHFDENIPANQPDLINWNDFFSSYLMFQLAGKLAELKFDYLILYRRTSNWEREWISKKGPYSIIQRNVLYEIAKSINNENEEWEMASTLIEIAKEILVNKDNVETKLTLVEIFEQTKSIKSEYWKNEILKELTFLQAKIGSVLESINTAKYIIYEECKCHALIVISIELLRSGNVTESNLVKTEALQLAHKINKDSTLEIIAITLCEKITFIEPEIVINESLKIIKEIKQDKYRSDALINISIELIKYFKFNEALLLLNESLIIIKTISDNFWISKTLNKISNQVIKIGNKADAYKILKDSLIHAFKIEDQKRKISILIEISNLMSIISYHNKSEKLLFESLSIAKKIGDEREKNSSLKTIAIELAKQRKILDSIKIIKLIQSEVTSYQALESISSIVAERGLIPKILIDSIFDIDDLEDKNNCLKVVINELIQNGKLSETITLLFQLLVFKTTFDKQNTLNAFKLLKFDEKDLNLINKKTKNNVDQNSLKIFNKSLKNARKLKEIKNKSSSILNISIELYKLGNISESELLLAESLQFALCIDNEVDKNRLLSAISIEFAIQGFISQALKLIDKINDNSIKYNTFCSLSIYVAKSGIHKQYISKIQFIINDKLKNNKFHDLKYGEKLKNGILYDFAYALAEENKLNKSLSTIGYITSKQDRNKAFAAVTFVIAKKGSINKVEKIALNIENINERNWSFWHIGKNAVIENGFNKAISNFKLLKNEENKRFYIKGVIQNIYKVNYNIFQQSAQIACYEYTEILHLLRMFAINQISFISNNPLDKLEKFNKILDVQWAIDLKKELDQLPN